MSYLIRTKSGPFALKDSWTLEEILDMADAGRSAETVTPLDTVLKHLPAVVVMDSALVRVKNGNPLYQAGVARGTDERVETGDLVRLYSSFGQLVAIARVKTNPVYQDQLYYQPETVF